MLLGDFQALGFSGDIRTLALAAGFVGRYSDSQRVFGRHLDAWKLLSVQMSPDNVLCVRFTPGSAACVRIHPTTRGVSESSPVIPWRSNLARQPEAVRNPPVNATSSHLAQE